MKVLLLDTNVASILFKTNNSLQEACLRAVAGRQLMISFTTRTESMLWPVTNKWGDPRRSARTTRGLVHHALPRRTYLCDLG